MTTSTFQQRQEAEQRAGIERRNQERQHRWHGYLMCVDGARRHMPGHPDEITWSHLRSCRKALEAALEALGQIETVMPVERGK